MNIDVNSMRSEAKKIKDAASREDALRGLRELENLELDTQRRRDEINREFREKQSVYKPQSKIRLTLLTTLSLLASVFGVFELLEILATGSYTFSRTQHIITVDANPMAYWIYFAIFAVAVFFFLLATLVLVLSLLRHPHPPFNGLSKKADTVKTHG